MANIVTKKNASTRLRIFGTFAMVFGLVTIFAGGSVALGLSQARQAAGNVVEFVVWFNFLAGPAYVIAGLGMWRQKRWAGGLGIAIFVTTGLVLLLFLWHVSTGATFEPRTGYALGFRTLIWGALAFFTRSALTSDRP